MSRYLILGLLALLALVVGAACTESPTPTPTQEPVALEEPAPAPTDEAMAMEEPTLTPTDEVMVMEEPVSTPTDEAMVMEEPNSTPTHEAMVMEEPTSTAIPTLTRPLAEGELVSDIADFVLQDLTIEVGATVTWTNRDVSPHTYTSGQPDGITGIWNSDPLATGRSFSFTFNQTGTFLYFCTIHPSIMQASVTVVESLPGGPIVATPEPTPRPTSTPTPETIGEKPTVQEVAIIENYAATRFFPRWIVVLKDIPVRLYLTRLHREHVNKFTIEPFYSSSEVILPGEIGVIEFLPNQVGEFKISNVGHGFDATLVVVETVEEAKKKIAEREIQMYALIHNVDDSKIFPDRLVVQEGIPTTIHNISLVAEHRVSIEPFYSSEDFNVKPREISRFVFTPDQTGEFTIRHEIHGITGEFIVEEK